MNYALRFAALACVAASAVAVQAQSWSVQTLDMLGYTGGGLASGINNSGQIVGYVYDVDGKAHGVRWSPAGVAQELGYISNVQESEAYRINSSGQIVGKARAADGVSHAVIWNSGVATDLGTLGGAYSFAQDINDAGVVVGSSYMTNNAGSHAFVWSAGTGMQDYGSFFPNDPNYHAGFNGINSSGKLVGTGYRLFEPFRAISSQLGVGGITDLGPTGRTDSMANAVNDSGVIVGYAQLPSIGTRAVIINGQDDYINLGDLGLGESRANDISNSGWIVGEAFGLFNGDFAQRGFAWKDGQIFDLTSYLPANSDLIEITSALGVNDNGQIVGFGYTALGEGKAVLLNPVPEPASIAALGLGILSALSRRKKK